MGREEKVGEQRGRGKTGREERVPVDRMNRFRSFFECSKREGS